MRQSYLVQASPINPDRSSRSCQNPQMCHNSSKDLNGKPGVNRKCSVEFECRCSHALAIAAMVLAGAGCQTFNLSEEDFQKQQRGGVADQRVGAAVSAAGTAAYLGAMIGAAAAGIK